MAKRRWVRRTLGLGLLAGAAYAVWRAIEANRSPTSAEWEPQPFPFPPQPRSDLRPEKAPGAGAERRAVAAPADTAAGEQRFVEPTEGACPATHPVKAKLSSKIFHVPGGLSYERTVPDRCYVDAAAAEAEGFRAAKR
ncbi:MAG: hypothetical protein WEC34_07380 [Acidimicrobiia bacterium]